MTAKQIIHTNMPIQITENSDNLRIKLHLRMFIAVKIK